jgi:hypothetical protein
VTIQGGLSTGRTSTDVCALQAALPETQTGFGILAVSRADCNTAEPFQTQFKMLGTYLVPKVDVQFGVTFQSAPGPAVFANQFVSGGEGGVPTFSGAPFRLVGLLPTVQPYAGTTSTSAQFSGSTQYYDRANQLDLRFSKIFRIGAGKRYRATINFDMANALNSNDILAAVGAGNVFNAGYGPSWLIKPLNIMDARLFKLSGQFDF